MVAGWGRTQEGSNPSEILRKVVVPIITDEECQKMYDDYEVVTDNMICAGYSEGGKDFCGVSWWAPSPAYLSAGVRENLGFVILVRNF